MRDTDSNGTVLIALILSAFAGSIAGCFAGAIGAVLFMTWGF
jgi:hypothetical protein